ncbi:hypothetical protein [uncultured Alsobacter sp.]|uniref:hypothetical protein n=1 Tax=uncultured Alsobacter sp. TaxID=1748258 RepID=UPI0025F151BC|nr:hypothetical protein [uncultured Alsobacter sp.]
MSFFGKPSHEPRLRDISRHADTIREIERTKGRDAALKIATAAIEGILLWICTAVSPREAAAILDRVRTDVLNGRR